MTTQGRRGSLGAPSTRTGVAVNRKKARAKKRVIRRRVGRPGVTSSSSRAGIETATSTSHEYSP
jgi:hypothetical protein